MVLSLKRWYSKISFVSILLATVFALLVQALVAPDNGSMYVGVTSAYNYFRLMPFAVGAMIQNGEQI